MRLIDADAFHAELNAMALKSADGILQDITIYKIKKLLDKIPTVELQMGRPQGEWITGGKDVTGQYFYDEFICNQCFAVVTDKSNFCPKCGAKMKGDIADE